MKGILICPDIRPAVARLSEFAPLGNVPLLGQGLVEYWLEHLATLGAKEVYVLAADRPEEVRAQVGDGSRWGLRVEVFPEIRELTTEEARAKYDIKPDGGWMPEPNDVVVLDHLPGLPQQTLLAGYAEWFEGVFGWLSHPASPLQVGTHELQPGIWVGLRAHIAPTARIQPPCWLGENVWIGPKAVVGPRVVLENRAFVEAGATISNSIVGPETFVGRLANLQDSIAWGRTVINWRAGDSADVAEPYLVSALRRPRTRVKGSNWIGRLTALGLMLLTLPAAALVMGRSKWRGRPPWRNKVALCPHMSGTPQPEWRLEYYELDIINRWLRRWPQLWNIVRGQFTWVGNRPLSPEDAADLRDDFERLWLAAPIGLVSLADAVGCPQSFSQEARAHASFYAVKANWKLDARIFARTLTASLLCKRSPRVRSSLPVSFPAGVVNDG